MDVWGFFYNSCTYESAAALQDLYISEEVAIRAMNTHKEFSRKEYEERHKDEDDEYMKRYLKQYPFGHMESWFVEKLIVKE